MSSNLNHLLYAGQVSDLNSKFRKLHREGGKDLTEQAKKAVGLSEKYLNENSEEYLEAFSNLSTVYFDKQQFDQSKKLLIKMVDQVDIDLLNLKEKGVYSSILNNLGVCYFSLENFTQSAKYLARCYELKKKLKYGYYQLTGLVEDLAGSFIELKQLEKAKYYWTDVSAIAGAEFGTESYDYLDSLSDLFNFLDHNGMEAEADALDLRYTELETKLNSGKLSGTTYQSAVDEAKRQYDQGNFVFAQSIHRRIVASTPAMPGMLSAMSILGHTMDPLVEYADHLDNLAQIAQKQGKFDKAIRNYEEITEIVKTSLGGENLRVAYALNNLGDALIGAGQLSRAREILAQCLQVINLPLNRRDKNRARLIENYAKVIYEQSLVYAPELDSAEMLSEQYQKRNAPAEYERSMRIRMVIPLENEPPVETLIRGFQARQAFYESIGNYEVVLKLLENIAELSEVYYVEEPQKAIEARTRLADGYVFQGKFDQAEKIYLDLLRFAQENLAENEAEYILLLHIVGNYYGETGNYSKARKFLEKALGLSQTLPERIPQLEYYLKKDLIAAYHFDTGKESQDLMREVLAEINADEVTDPVDIQAFASYYAQLSDLDKAEPLYEKAIAILKEEKGEWNLDYALAISNLANLYRFRKKYREALHLYRQSLRIREVELGTGHPKLVASLVRLAITYGALGDGAHALEVIKRVTDIDDKSIDNMFSHGSQEQKLAFLRGVNADADLCFSIILQFFPDVPGAIDYGIRLVQKRKSIFGDSLLAMDNSGSPDDRRMQLETELEGLKKNIAAGAYNQSAITTERASQRLEELERLLTPPGYELENQLDLAALKNSLPQNGAALEMLKFNFFQFKADYQKDDPETVSIYIAFLVNAGAAAANRLIDLGPAGVIDEAIEQLRAHILAKSTGFEAISKLSKTIIGPLSAKLKGVDRLIFCPDGDFSLLPLDVLLLEDVALIDRCVISRAEKFADIIRPKLKKPVPPGRPVVVAFPDYFATQNATSRPQAVGFAFAPLEGTLQEGKIVSGITGGRLVTGGEASKEFFEGIRSPLILHIATHAFYGKTMPGFEHLPFLKSGLALAGANGAPGANEGILTAEEVSYLDLAGTELVVLSACDTARGERINREGEFGLEKAFKVAGAKRLLVSLWEVPDQATTLLMELFYQNLYQGNDLAVSLRMAKQTLKKKFPDPVYWSSFVLSGASSTFPLKIN